MTKNPCTHKADTPELSFVVTCKGRLSHLRQSLPSLAGQPGTECLVVDFDCPDGTAGWVAANFPEVRIVKVNDAPLFHLARARNLGATAATATWLVFVDADISVSEHFAETVRPELTPGYYYRPSPLVRDACGTTICGRKAFMSIGGYDEALEGWGSEDEDFYRRLAACGCGLRSFPGSLLTPLAHDVEARVTHYSLKNPWLNWRINALYLQIKYDVERQIGEKALTLPVRRRLREVVAARLNDDAHRGVKISRIEISIPGTFEIPMDKRWLLRRNWTYELEWSGDAAEPEIRLRNGEDFLF